MVADFSRYKWTLRAHTPDDQSLIREAAGGELMEYVWRGLGLGDYVLIFLAELAFAGDMPRDAMLTCMRHAWAAVRYDIPTVAAHTFYDAANRTQIVYTPARSSEDAMAWAARTVRLVDGFASMEDFRHTLSTTPIRDANGDQTFVYVLPDGLSVGGCSVLVRTSHITFDAKGLQALFCAFMKKLAGAIARYPAAAYTELEWGTEGKNVLPAPYEILDEAEVCDGPEYDATLKSVVSDGITSAQNAHGLKFDPPSGYAHETKRANFTFSVQDSQAFFARTKALGFTVNHVCHAALTLATAEDNPVPEDKLASAVFAYSHLIDGRRRLRAPYSDREGYPGFCLGTSTIQIPAHALAELPAREDATRLLYVSGLMKEAYTRQNAHPSLIAIAPERAEIMISPFKNNPNPPALASTAPWYSGDGRGELYLDPEYVREDGQRVAEIVSFVTTVSKLDPAPFFRVWSWRGRLTVSVDYNPHATPEQVVENILSRWKQLVASLM